APIRKIAVSQGEVRASQSVAPPRETGVVGILLGESAEGGLPSFGDAPCSNGRLNSPVTKIGRVV
ncbi:MAG: hypothetical protein O2960_18585, partial [Verrucomicrobia bacterium]|nr:hypothetical protein [Verrucomicrobiota bacterium]